MMERIVDWLIGLGVSVVSWGCHWHQRHDTKSHREIERICQSVPNRQLTCHARAWESDEPVVIEIQDGDWLN